MDSKTSNLIKGRKKLSYMTADEGPVLPRIESFFSIRGVNEYLDYVSETKADSGRLLPKSTADAEADAAEEDAPQEEECVARPTDETNPGQDRILDKDRPFKDSAPLKTSSPILVATDVHEAGGEEEPVALPLLLADDNEDPIKGNVDQPLSTQEGDVAKEPTLDESLTLTPPKRFTLGVKAQQGSLSPVIAPLTTGNHVIPVEKNLPGASKNHTVEVAKIPKPPVAVRDPSPQKLDDDDDDDDFFLLDYDIPVLFSLKRKTESQTSHGKKPREKPEAKSGTRAKGGASSAPENEPGAEGDAAGAAALLKPPPKRAARAALPSQHPPKSPAAQKKRSKQSELSGGGGEAHEVGEDPPGLSLPSEHPPKSPVVQRKRSKQGKRVRRGAGVGEAAPADTPGAGGVAPGAAPKETLLKAQDAQKRSGKRSKRAETKVGPEDHAPAEAERQPVTATSKPQAPTAGDEDDDDDDGGDHGDGLVPQSPAERPQGTCKSVKQKTRKVASSRPFSSKSPPSQPTTNTRAADAAPPTYSPEEKRTNEQGHPPEKRKRKRPAVVQPEEGEEEGGEEPNATGETDLSESSVLGKRRRSKPGSWWAINLEEQDTDHGAPSGSPPKRKKKSRREDVKKPKKTGTPGKERAQTSLEQDSARAAEESRNPTESPQQHIDTAKAPLKPRQRKVKGDGQPDRKKAQTGKRGRRRPREEAASPRPDQSEEQVVVGVAGVAELQVNISPAAPSEQAHTSRGGKAADVPQPSRRQRRPTSNWWEGQQQQQAQQEKDIIPSPSPSPALSSPPHPVAEPSLRVPTPGVLARGSRSKQQRAVKPASGSRKRNNHLRKNLLTQHAGTPKTFKGSLAAFGAIYTSGKPHSRNAATRSQVRKNLMNSLEDSSNRSPDHTSMDGNSQNWLNCEDANQEISDRVSSSVGLNEVMELKKGGVAPASNWPSQNHSVPGLKSGPSSMVELISFEEAEEEQTLPSTLRMPMALSEGEICGPLLKPLTLVPGDWQNLTYWLRQVWRTSVKLTGQVITADHFHWYTHEGRALGHRFDLVCSSYANGKLLLGSYMRKPAQVDQQTTTVFNLYTSSVRVQINDLKSDYHPGQAFVVPRGQSYSIRNLTPVPAILWYHRMFADITEES